MINNPTMVIRNKNRELSAGMFVKFRYGNQDRTAFVLDVNWKSKLHALALDDEDQKKTLFEEILDIRKDAPRFSDNDIQKEIYPFYENTQISREDYYRTFNWDKITELKRIVFPQKIEWLVPELTHEEMRVLRQIVFTHKLDYNTILNSIQSHGALTPMTDQMWMSLANTKSWKRILKGELRRAYDLALEDGWDIEVILHEIETGGSLDAPVVFIYGSEPPQLLAGEKILTVCRGCGIQPFVHLTIIPAKVLGEEHPLTDKIKEKVKERIIDAVIEGEE